MPTATRQGPPGWRGCPDPEGIHDIDAKCMAYSEAQRLLLVGDTQNFVSVLVVDEKLTAFRVLGQPAMPRCEDSTVKTAVRAA